MAEHHPVSDNKHKSSLNSGASYSGNGRSSTAVEARGSDGTGGGGLSGGLSQPAGWQSLLSFTVLFLAWLAGFSSRLFAVIRFESIIHEFDPWCRMYSFLGGGLFCAGVGNILLIVSTATDYWMQYRQSNNYMHQGLWRYCMPGKCFPHNDSIAHLDATRALMILSLLACFIGIIIGIMAFIHYSSFDRFDKTFAAGILFFISCFLVFLAMAVYTGVTINYYGKRYGNWRFSWSYIMGWVSMVLTFFSGIFYMCAYRMHECPRNANSH